MKAYRILFSSQCRRLVIQTDLQVDTVQCALSQAACLSSDIVNAFVHCSWSPGNGIIHRLSDFDQVLSGHSWVSVPDPDSESCNSSLFIVAYSLQWIASFGKLLVISAYFYALCSLLTYFSQLMPCTLHSFHFRTRMFIILIVSGWTEL